MTNAYAIEVHDESVGLLVREGRAYRFVAAARDVHALEGRRFRGPDEATRAAVRELAARRSPAPKTSGARPR